MLRRRVENDSRGVVLMPGQWCRHHMQHSFANLVPPVGADTAALVDQELGHVEDHGSHQRSVGAGVLPRQAPCGSGRLQRCRHGATGVVHAHGHQFAQAQAEAGYQVVGQLVAHAPVAVDGAAAEEGLNRFG